jgi:hypothetical protein
MNWKGYSRITHLIFAHAFTWRLRRPQNISSVWDLNFNPVPLTVVVGEDTVHISWYVYQQKN